MDSYQPFYGWYDDASQPREKPTYDPPRDGPCLCCGHPLRPDDMRTHSLMLMEYAARSYFYRTHRSCHDELIRAGEPPPYLDETIFAMIARNGD